ncbi:aldo/keto reductase [Weissella paramesenteroides]|jgi:diketogulonate reductase-like aldo/keto reductase|uniref:Aldo/keto reductase n=1 Tax=Weissella paramesenteroides TaxID=1249 RepID=A0ABD4XI78_WEIPA|nr:aldo/keto reductase [Weissella paramesenteroides]KAA8439872.1 aldo/keto reductase [Weissella paramesenteroides]KAA8441371.1 aldo/keto reductase [Weissella paramesenteroides]KAA8444113.1 aldo/keto reductase [Weissella paramesenteroides]KAA8448682.1 aldo/keto reductase [Weissella paramesenteroides]KAA8450791.1 aldo/keto reductase [Weissella paramesenteroides]
MKKVTLAGVEVPAIGIGTWHMGEDPSQEQREINAIRSGLDAGARLIDTAEMYGSGKSETLVGKALAPYQRDEIYLVSKVLPNNASQAKLARHLDETLHRLKTDYLDLYLYHWRGSVPLAETIAELDRMKQIGKIKAWGVSNFDVADMEELWELPAGKYAAVNEDLYNIEERGIEYDLLPWQDEHQVPLIAYSPVGGKQNELGTSMLTNQVVREIADQHDVTPYVLLLAWIIRNGQTIAIPQTNNPEHAAANMQATKLELTPAELKRLDQEYPKPNHKVPLAIN